MIFCLATFDVVLTSFDTFDVILMSFENVDVILMSFENVDVIFMKNTYCLFQIKFITEYSNVQHIIITQI
jgi:hypothetical protein